MKTSEFLRQLRKKGCRFYRQAKGSHEIWIGPNGEFEPIPVHSKEMKIGLAEKIKKRLGVK